MLSSPPKIKIPVPAIYRIKCQDIKSTGIDDMGEEKRSITFAIGIFQVEVGKFRPRLMGGTFAAGNSWAIRVKPMTPEHHHMGI